MERVSTEPVSTEPALGVFGGSGLYAIEGLEERSEVELSTPFGAPSDAFLVGRLSGTRLVFLPRHGRGHRIGEPVAATQSPDGWQITIGEQVTTWYEIIVER